MGGLNTTEDGDEELVPPVPHFALKPAPIDHELPSRSAAPYNQAANQAARTALDVLGYKDVELKELRQRDEKGERELLSRLLNVPAEQPEIIGTLREELFCLPTRGMLASTMVTLVDKGFSLSPESLREHILQRTRNQTQIPALLNELSQIELVRTPTPVVELVAKLERVWRARTVNQLIFSEAARRYDNGEDIDTLTEFMEKVLLDLTKTKRKKKKWGDVVRAVHKQIIDPDKTKAALDLGLRDWDIQFGGIKRDRVYTVGGYTGSGKTAFIIDVLYRLMYYHREKIAVKFWTLEMSEERIAQRFFSRAAQVAVKRQDDWWVKVRHDEDSDELVPIMEELSADEIRRINQALPLLEDFEQCFECQYASMNVEQMRREARQFKMLNKDKHCIFILDHMGLVQKDGGDNRMEFDNIINAMKDIAREHDATCFPLIQLDKSVESRFNKPEYYRPNNSNLMESVGVEAASDAVILLWRPHKYFEAIPYMNAGLGIFCNEDDGETWDCRHRMIAIIGKNRDGTGHNDIVFDADMGHNKLYNYDRMRKEIPELFLQVELTEISGFDISRADQVLPPLPRPSDPNDLPF